MTPEYILRASLCDFPSRYRARVQGEGYVNDGKIDPTFLDHCYRVSGASDTLPLDVLADWLDDKGMHDEASYLRAELARVADYRKQWHSDAMSAIANLGHALAYAERRYTDPDKGILFSNWNLFSKRVCNLLERYGYSLEWEDEWCTCSDCGNAVRTQPDSMAWEPAYHHDDGQLWCQECCEQQAIDDSRD